MTATARQVWEAQQLRPLFTIEGVSQLTGFSVAWVKRNTNGGDIRVRNRHCASTSENSFHCDNPKPLPCCLMIFRGVL